LSSLLSSDSGELSVRGVSESTVKSLEQAEIKD
jgi:hypothetical protein